MAFRVSMKMPGLLFPFAGKKLRIGALAHPPDKSR
jgi:hypothetical protein